VSTRFLALYLSGLLALACILVSLITVVPDVESVRTLVQGICAVGAALAAAVGLSCSLVPAEHIVNRSSLLRSVLAALAIGLTLFLLVGVVG